MPELCKIIYSNNIDEAITFVMTNNGRNSTLSLSGKKLNDNDVVRLCEGLAQNQSWTSLILSCNAIGDTAAVALAQITSLVTLDLADNKISNAGALALAKNNSISELDLSDNCISDAGAIALAKNRRLTTLNLDDNYIGDAGAIALAQNSSITTLDFSFNEIGDSCANAISQNKRLTTLDVSANEIGDAGAIALAQNRNLTILRRGANSISHILYKPLAESIQSNRNTQYNAYLFSLIVKQSLPFEIFSVISSLLVSNSVHQKLNAFSNNLFFKSYKTRLLDEYKSENCKRICLDASSF